MTPQEVNPTTGASQTPLYALSAHEVYAALQSRPEGLTQAEAEQRLSVYGPNALREKKGKPIILRLAASFTHVMAVLLWVGGAAAFLARMPQMGIAVWAVNLINGAFSFWQEFRAEQATEALKKLLPTYARVVRDGSEQRISAEELVPGDVMLLAEGDRVSADGRLVDEAELQADQSTLSGESAPVRKIKEAIYLTDQTTVERRNLVFAGTNVAAGTGRAVVNATGMHTELGQIADLTQTMKEEASPLQKELVVATRRVTVIAVAVGLLFFVVSVALVGVTLIESFVFALGMIVAFVPEGMLPTVTLSLALGVQRMAKRHALVKRLSAVETLGCTTVICTDKTGTLTQNEMTVSELWTGGRSVKVTGVGYAPEGSLKPDGSGALSAPEQQDLQRLLRAMVLCNNARLLAPNEETPRWSILGDPTEAALLVVAQKGGLDSDGERQECSRLRELPFESRRKRMSTVCRMAECAPGERVVCVKGAPREMLELCTHIRVGGEELALEDGWRERIAAANDAYARSGLRVLAVAQRLLDDQGRASSSPSELTVEVVESDLTFLGLVAMMDPPRAEVAEAVDKCHRAGIRIVMITGDYGLTAESIARRVGIVLGEHPPVVTGSQLDSMDDASLHQVLQGEVIFARVAPEHKLRVVQALQDLGQVVAVTGDGVNDAPALKKANIGVAMGMAGTDVAKEAADMILTDDNFASIVNAIEEGRAVYDNIKKFCTYIFTSNAPEAVPFIVYALTAGRIPLALNVMHVLAVDLGTDLVPALALGSEPPEPGVMDRPPRSLKEHVVSKGMLLRAYAYLGVFQGAVAMLAFYFMYWTNGYAGQWIDLPASGPLYRAATAMCLASVVMTQIGNVFAQRSERVSAFSLGWFRNRLIWVGIASELALIALMVYAPFMQRFIGTSQFPVQNWLFLFALTPVLLMADEVRKLVARRMVVVREHRAGHVTGR